MSEITPVGLCLGPYVDPRGVGVSCERGTPVRGGSHVSINAGISRKCPSPVVRPFLITEFMKEVSPLLPNPCHFRDYDRSMLSPAQPGSEGCPPKMCTDEVNAEDEGEVG